MTRTFSRRQLLRGATCTAAALMAGGSNRRHDRAHAIEPIPRPGTPKFKFSLAAYSYRQLLSGKEARLSLEDFIRDCAALELEGTELTSYYFPQPVTPEYLRQLKALAFRLGLSVSGTAVGNDFCHPPGAPRDQQLAHVKRWIEYAEILGAPVIRIFAGTVKSGQDPAEAHRLIVEGIEHCCEYAGQHGVYLALENHGGPTATAEGLLKIVRDVRSPWFGVNLDTGNFHSAELYDELAQCAPYALNVQVKVAVKPAGQDKQPADLLRVSKILQQAGYRGWVVLEYEEGGDPRKACAHWVQEMREAFCL